MENMNLSGSDLLFRISDTVKTGTILGIVFEWMENSRDATAARTDFFLFEKSKDISYLTWISLTRL